MKYKLFIKYLKYKYKENPSIYFLFKYLLLRSPHLLYLDMKLWDQKNIKKKNLFPYHCKSASANGKESILICTHEFSLTGVPVLALNLAEFFSKKYHVIIIGYGEGALLKYFELPSVSVVIPHFSSADFESMAHLINVLNAEFKIKFAISTTIACYSVPPAVSALNIPNICLVNEYAGIYASKTCFDVSLLWSDCSFFSSNFLLTNALDEIKAFKGENAYVLPQGKCKIPTPLLSTKFDDVGNKNILEWIKLKESLKHSKLILGVGSINYRKGVDIFIQCAFELSKKRNSDSFKFLWIGDGIHLKGTDTYQIYLHDQIKRLGLTKDFHFIGPMDSLDDVYRTAALILIPSRVDPLPNVAIDAMATGTPFVYFDQATGISDALKGLVGMRAEAFKAEYLDVGDMAKKAFNLINNRSDLLLEDIQSKINKEYEFDKYAEKLESYYPYLQLKCNILRDDIEVISKDPNFRPDFFSGDPSNTSWPNENLARFYIKCWAAKISRRKPLPGFNPAIYSDLNNLMPSDGDPYAHYLSAGKPKGRWSPDLIGPWITSDKVAENLSTLRAALHIHAYYPALFPAILERLALNRVSLDLFISVGSKDHINKIEEYLKDYPGTVKKIAICPNIGRDIGPLITEFGIEIATNYSYFGHLHTKLTKHLDDPSIGQIWYEFLLENLLGGHGGAMADKILSTMLQTPDLDLVFADDPNVIGWDANLAIAEMLAFKLGVEQLPNNFNFPVGTMFWGKTEILRNLLKLNLTWADYPNEPLANDGTLLHAIERIIPFLTSSPGEGYAVTNVPGITRY